MYLPRVVGSRGRGHGRGRGSEFLGHPPVSQSEDVLPTPASSQQLLHRVNQQTLDSAELELATAAIKDVQYVTSYNWLDRSTPSVAIPGIPPKWLPPGSRVRLSQDEGNYYRDPNAARYPEYPLKPAIAAAFQTNPRFASASIDVFACGTILGSLLSFVNGEDRTFRFGVELVGQTLFLVRKTNTPNQLIGNVYGYGHNFADAYTTWDSAVRGSVSHQRIISYDFAGLKCLVRSECDGYLPEKLPSIHTTYSSYSKNDTSGHGDNIQTLHRGHSTNKDSFKNTHEAFDDLRVGHQQPPTETKKSGLSIKRTKSSTSAHDLGVIPQTAIFDLKTRSIRKIKEIQVDEFLPRLWVNQTPNFILAYHEAGLFRTENIQIHDIRSKLRDWELAHQKELLCLATILKVLRDMTGPTEKQTASRTLEVRRESAGDLEIWTAPLGWRALSEKWSKRWTGSISTEAEAEVEANVDHEDGIEGDGDSEDEGKDEGKDEVESQDKRQ